MKNETHISVFKRKARIERRKLTLANKTPVITPDGPGVIVSEGFRMNTNGGPGTRQYKVKLDDGRYRHYSKPKVREKK